MKLHRTTRYNPELFNLVPLVNVLVLVLAFVTLGNTFILQPGVSVTLPFSTFALGPQRNPQIVSITGGAIPLIYFREEKVTMQELDEKLAHTGSRDRSIIVRADRSVPYDIVSRVMNIGLQRGYSVMMAASAQPR